MAVAATQPEAPPAADAAAGDKRPLEGAEASPAKAARTEAAADEGAIVLE